ncbi:MAG: hypothetical protein NZ927_08400 [Candidatus Calescibacterium sp.]|nr:hypothetical protein [Candidatus Calescibacterium sp.]MCX7734096.1 hypothetical protein [bacterium]MDW8087838.1 hypothetical protein [Candidatus Calescibacterium sp.]
MFITNTAGTKNLAERLNQIIEKSSELKFLVGFFYFSGIQQLYETLKKLYEEGRMKDKFLKILVGLDIDSGVYGLYEFTKNSSEIREDEVKNRFLESLKRAFNSPDTDKKEIYEQIDFF